MIRKKKSLLKPTVLPPLCVKCNNCVQWASCQCRISMLPSDSWHLCPTGAVAESQVFAYNFIILQCVILTAGRCHHGKSWEFAVCGGCSTAAVALSEKWRRSRTYSSVSEEERKSPEPTNIILLVNLSPLHYTTITTTVLSCLQAWFISPSIRQIS